MRFGHPGCIALTWFGIMAVTAHCQVILDLDISGGLRTIPDIESGGFTSVTTEEIIDIVILGDGYLAGELSDFEADAQAFYDEYFHPTTGLFPYSAFSEAFRVRAVFTPSNDRSNDARDTYYKTNVTCPSSSQCNLVQCNVLLCNGGPQANQRCDSHDDCPDASCVNPCWVEDGGATNVAFREALFSSIDLLRPDINFARYPRTLSNAVGGGNIVPAMGGNYSNLYVGLIIRADETGPSANERPAGAFAATVEALLCDGGDAHGRTCTSNTDCPGGGICRLRRVRAALAQEMPHEFGHAFGYLRDEYICTGARGSTAPGRVEPSPANRSVFLLSNLTYTNDRAQVPWAHLAPGGAYNPNRRSIVGNLFKGGCAEDGVWHSEYKCLMNGQHDNYTCCKTEALRCSSGPNAGQPCNDGDDCPEATCTGASLRDRAHFCFWCQEILVLRILERTGQLARAGDSSDINVRGRQWYDLWDADLRDAYYARYDLPTRIREQEACMGFATCPSPGACTGICDAGSVPAGLPSCEITELVDALYVNGLTGASTNPGTRTAPLSDVEEAAFLAALTGRSTVAIERGFYPDTIVLSHRARLIPGSCAPVVLGR